VDKGFAKAFALDAANGPCDMGTVSPLAQLSTLMGPAITNDAAQPGRDAVSKKRPSESLAQIPSWRHRSAIEEPEV
jgi:hypothetical protein